MSTDTTDDGELQAILDRVRDVDGWMTDAQAQRLFDAARRVPASSTIVEIGSFHGRSTIVLASAAPAPVTVTAVDPHLGSDRGPQEIAADRELGEDDNARFRENLAGAGVTERVHHVRALSASALAQVPERIDVLYIDGAHRYRPARDDIVDYGARVPAGGTLLIHDAFSSIGVTLALLRAVSFGDDWHYIGRSGSLAEYRRLPSPARRDAARWQSSARQVAQLPWFARNVVVKTLLTARLTGAARALGHDVRRDGPWPY